MKNNLATAVKLSEQRIWRGLGIWNLYFIIKLALYLTGFINFDVFYNILFAAFLLVPLGFKSLRILRNIIALPLAMALLYYDSWLPPFQRLLEQPEVLNFSNDYLFELFLRFINWNVLGAGLILVVVYSFLAQWLRMTTWTLLALLLVALPSVPSMPRVLWGEASNKVATAVNISHDRPTTLEPRSGDINTVLNQELELFYQNEQQRVTAFPLPVADAAPFDLLFINICSLSWSDLEVTQLVEHPLFARMDIVFDQFNSATSYSGPSVLRLMRASCGQSPHDELYTEADSQCYLFKNLKQLGFAGSAALNHTGEFEGFIDDINLAGFSAPALVPSNLRPKLKSFDATPIWGDYDTLKLWWDDRLEKKTPAEVLLYNSISLHDGNREATADGGSRSAPYEQRAKRLLDELNAFMTELEASGRQVMLVFVPEHGAALEGDRMQIAGMREIPTPDITHVPVAVRLIGTKSAEPAHPLHVSTPTSFLALSELVARVLSRDVFAQENIDWPELVVDLPETRVVSENSGTVMMTYQGEPYIRLGERDWVKYAR